MGNASSLAKAVLPAIVVGGLAGLVLGVYGLTWCWRNTHDNNHYWGGVAEGYGIGAGVVAAVYVVSKVTSLIDLIKRHKEETEAEGKHA